MIIFTLLKQYWRIALAVAFIGALTLHVWSDNRVKAQRDGYKAQLTAIELLAEHQKKDYEAKLKYAEDNQAKSEQVFKQQVDKLNINKESLTNELRSIYANRKPKPNLVPVAGGVLPQSSSAESTTETASSAEGFAIREPIPDTAFTRLEAQYQTLEDACALTTIYFNQARARIDQDCAQIGCQINPMASTP